MNFFLSHNWLKEILPDLREEPEEIAAKLTEHSAAVDRLVRFADLWKGIVVGKVETSEQHPNADRLTVNTVSCGRGKKAIVVCGGVNVVKGMLVAYAQPGATVKWHGEGELVTLEKTKIRGVVSEGMICAGEEISLEKMSQPTGGILDLTWTEAKPGTELVKALDMDDALYDIEITTNRPDMMSVRGIAREVATIFDVTMAEISLVHPRKPAVELPLMIRNQAGVLCPRYQAVVFSGITVEQSPWWMQKRLLMGGVRPINNIVDVTNYVLLEVGQPLHAFDYETLANHEIVVRGAKKSEKIIALDDVEYALRENMIVIADHAGPVAIAGLMGGKHSGITGRTNSFVLEIATFDAHAIRKASRALNLRSESQIRFEKGLSPHLTPQGLSRAVCLFEEICNARIASVIFDVGNFYDQKTSVLFSPAHIQQAIGVDMREGEMRSILSNLGFRIHTQTSGVLIADVPFWRENDIEGICDLTEEVARMAGYSALPARLLPGPPPPHQEQERNQFEAYAKKTLADWGFTEVIVPSFVSSSLLEKAGFSTAEALSLKNPLNDDLRLMRTVLAPGMLRVIQENERDHSEGSLFEFGNIFLRNENDLPHHIPRMALAHWGRETDGRQFFALKGILEQFTQQAGMLLSFTRGRGGSLWNTVRAVEILVDGISVGFCGEVSRAVARAFGLEGSVALCEVDVLPFIEKARTVRRYTPPPIFPPARRDISFVIQNNIEYETIIKKMRSATQILSEIELFDVYTGKGVPEGRKSMAFHLTFLEPKGTLAENEIENAFKKVSTSLIRSFNADIRS